ncbi:hypothetical protein B5C34_12515 [Pacificimonas flava]|uniref:DUF2141 domain-containing protein n=2 Tax=Pacificimonas TaxID=1960290 RepID=A0A219B755_9SPHN|nr:MULTISPECIES: DUF2141 domain-containing protein [Pacificimonas]MBZ6378511.1 DUF2141 domain-containing protein [Pacificimonas aurantium]OWV34197.1 hypothetical protein B5C34_12515 [Pacificimonas flava]
MSFNAHPLLATVAGALLAALPTQAIAAEPCEGTPGTGKAKLEIIATDLKNAEGEVAFTVYPDDRSRFLAGGGKLARVRTKTIEPLTTACFWLPVGSYAVATYHDENADHDFNRTLFSIKEGFGFSNDAPTTLGLPSLKSARFELPASGKTIMIKTRYQR